MCVSLLYACLVVIHEGICYTHPLQVKMWFYNGISYPYYEVTIEGGDVCDLTGQPRKSHLRFICHKEAIFEVCAPKETNA